MRRMAKVESFTEVPAERLLDPVSKSASSSSSHSNSSLFSFLGLGSDLPNFVLLSCLYCFQGVPLGLCAGALPLLLKAKGASFGAVGVFGMATLPFSLKLFWAPVVDAFFVPSFGRRKTWIVPLQLIGGLIMCLLAPVVESLIMDSSIITLTACFFLLVFVYATQDVAVDGWALELLAAENLSYASTAQSVGQHVGFFSGFTIFIGMNALGWVTLSQFMFFWGALFVLSAAWVWLWQPEPPPSEELPSCKSMYLEMISVIRSPDLRALIAFLLLYQVPFVCSDRALHLRYLEAGFSKEVLSSFAFLGLPLTTFFAFLTGRWSRTGHPLTGPLRVGYAVRLVTSFTGMLILWTLPQGKQEPSWYMLFWMLLSYAGATFGSTLIFVAMCSHFNVISPKSMGGTYLTFLNSTSNLGRAWFAPICLFLVDRVGFTAVNSLSLLLGVAALLMGDKILTSLEAYAQKQNWV